MDMKALKNKLLLKPAKGKYRVFFNKWVVVSAILAFGLMLTFIDVTLSRNAAIKSFKNGIATVIADLNEIGLDVAYEEIDFDNVFVYPLMKIKNLSVYNLKGKNLWQVNIENVSARPRWWGWKKIKFDISGNIKIKFDDNIRDINSDSVKMFLSLGKKYKFQSVELYFDEVNIKDFAKIKKATLISRLTENKGTNSILPMTMESHLEINNVTLNGLLNYPLTSNIRRIYMNLNLWGELSDKEGILIGAENWLKSGGFIDVSSVMISWDPLLLVGRGDVQFNEKFEPKISLHTSSKALLNFLNDLQEKKYLERKGVFVANILLGAKAFKAKNDDEYLTLTTPITYRDNKLAVENITVKNFN